MESRSSESKMKLSRKRPKMATTNRTLRSSAIWNLTLPRHFVVGIDFGSSSSCIVVRRDRCGEGLTWELKRQGTYTATWPDHNLRHYVWTKHAYHQDEDGGVIFGYDVDQALTNRTTAKEFVIKWLKQAILDPRGPEAQRIRETIEKLPGTAKRRLLKPNIDESGSITYNINYSQLLADYLRPLWEHCMRYLKAHQIYGTSSEEPRFRVAIAVPPSAPPESVWEIVEGAELAGIPDVKPFDEAVCAIHHIVQTNHDPRLPMISKDHVYIALNTGAATIDVAAYINEASPDGLVCATSLGIAESNIKHGGQSINGNFRRRVKEIIGTVGLQMILNDLKARRSYIRDEEALLDALELVFEQAKMRFRPENGDMFLVVPCLPRYLDYGMPEEGRFRMAQSDVESLFKPQLDTLQKMIERQARVVERIAPSKKITAIFFSGGTSHNPYVFADLRNRFEHNTNSVVGYRIRIMKCSEDVDTNIARGACLSRLDSEFMPHRELRYSYGVVWDVAVEDLGWRRSRIERARTNDEITNFLGVECGKDRAKLIYRFGDKVSDHETRSHRGLRYIAQDQPDSVLVERIIRSCTVREDNVFVENESRPENEITIAGTIEIVLTDKELSNFPMERREGSLHWKIEYQVNLTFINHVFLEYDFIIPRSGRFPETSAGKDVNYEDVGPDPIRRTARLKDNFGSFGLQNVESSE